MAKNAAIPFVPAFRWSGPGGNSAFAWLIDETSAVRTLREWEQNLAGEAVRIGPPEAGPICLVQFRFASAAEKSLVLQGFGRDAPYVCMAAVAGHGIAVAIGRLCVMMRPDQATAEVCTRTEFPIHNLLVATEDARLVVVTELSLLCISPGAQILWEYHHSEPIQSSWLSNRSISFTDLDDDKFAVDATDGRPIRHGS